MAIKKPMPFEKSKLDKDTKAVFKKFDPEFLLLGQMYPRRFAYYSRRVPNAELQSLTI